MDFSFQNTIAFHSPADLPKR